MGFIMLVVMMLMTASSAMSQEARFEVIDGLRYFLETDTKTACLMPKTVGKYSGDIVVPEKVKSSDEVEYSVTSLGESCFRNCSRLTSITIPSSVNSLDPDCFADCRSLKTVYFKGKVPERIRGYGGGIPTACIIKVPLE